MTDLLQLTGEDDPTFDEPSRRTFLSWVGAGVCMAATGASGGTRAQDVAPASVIAVDPFLLLAQRELGPRRTPSLLMKSRGGGLYAIYGITDGRTLQSYTYPRNGGRYGHQPFAFVYLDRRSGAGRLYLVDLAETGSQPVRRQLLAGSDVTDIVEVQPLNREGTRHLLTVVADGVTVRLRLKGAALLGKVARPYVSPEVTVMRAFYNADGSLRGCLAKEGLWILWFDAATGTRRNLIRGSEDSVISPVVERGILDLGRTYVYSIGSTLYRFDATTHSLTSITSIRHPWDAQFVALRDEAMVVRAALQDDRYSVVRTEPLRKHNAQTIVGARDPARSLAVMPGGVAFTTTDGRICFQGTNDTTPSASIEALPDGHTFGRLVWGGDYLYVTVHAASLMFTVGVRRIKLEPTPTLDPDFWLPAFQAKFVYDERRVHGVRRAMGVLYGVWMHRIGHVDYKVPLRYHAFSEDQSITLGTLRAMGFDEADADYRYPLLLWVTSQTVKGVADGLYSVNLGVADSLRRLKRWLR